MKRLCVWAAIAALGAAAGFSAPATAASGLATAAETRTPDGNWRLAQVGELDHSVEFIAPDSRVVNGDMAQVWSFSALRQPVPVNGNMSAGLWLLWQFDCKRKTVEAVQVVVLDRDFGIAEQTVPDDHATPLVADTLSDRLYHWACLGETSWDGKEVAGVRGAAERATAGAR